MENLNNEINLLKIKIFDNCEEIKKLEKEKIKISEQKDKREQELNNEKNDSFSVYRHPEIKVFSYKESRAYALIALLEQENKQIEEYLKLIITKNEILTEIKKDDEKIENITTIKRGKRL